VTIFSAEANAENAHGRSITRPAWQAHDTFRFFERAGVVLFADGSPFGQYEGKKLLIKSDGRTGRITLLD